MDPRWAPSHARTARSAAAGVRYTATKRNYVADESAIEELRDSDFEPNAQHDCNELRAEARHDYNESHMADAASHTHLSVPHTAAGRPAGARATGRVCGTREDFTLGADQLGHLFKTGTINLHEWRLRGAAGADGKQAPRWVHVGPPAPDTPLSVEHAALHAACRFEDFTLSEDQLDQLFNTGTINLHEWWRIRSGGADYGLGQGGKRVPRSAPRPHPAPLDVRAQRDAPLASASTMEVRADIVYVPMAADIMHHGHVAILTEAATYGPVVVGLLTDEAIASYKRTPIVTWEERARMLRAISSVAVVVPQHTHDYAPSLELLRPAYVVHGDDWKSGPQAAVRARVVECIAAWGGTLVEPHYTGGISTTEIIGRCRSG